MGLLPFVPEALQAEKKTGSSFPWLQLSGRNFWLVLSDADITLTVMVSPGTAAMAVAL